MIDSDTPEPAGLDPDMPANALGLDEPSQPARSSAGTGATPYRVLARKYRPQTFGELIGQDAMVQTLGNAIARDRLAHAFLMTGVRGVGKTSTARLIAKALNCIGPDGTGGPTIDPCGQCEPCVSITAGRNIDVVEMDAASHTGVEDVREIIEAVRYASVSARYKIYIIDEVHMLSKNAFNALLKTLEEPPDHVKFIFATTEVGKVPITVLSRCQRFDLRRITPEMLFAHFHKVLTAEGVEADDPAVWMIATAAEGSVRDGLSLLDQAIAHSDLEGAGRIDAAQVRTMLGLSDRGTVVRLLGAILDGDSAGAIELVRAQYALGVEPVALVRGLLDLVHQVALAKVGRHDNPALGDDERRAIGEWAGAMGMATVSRLWQLLVRGHDEVLRAGHPLDALDMLVLRVIHAGSMPDPGELARLLSEGGVPAMAPAVPASVNNAPAALLSPVSAANDASPTLESHGAGAPITVRDLYDVLDGAGRYALAQRLYDHVQAVAIEPGALTIAANEHIDAAFVRELTDALNAVTGTRWRVAIDDGAEATASLLMQDRTEADAETARIRTIPVVAAALAAFPDARILPNEQRQAS